MRKPVRFSSHAKQKFRILTQHGVVIKREQVILTVLNPEKQEIARKGRKLAQRGLDRTRVLRVVYEDRDNDLLVVTFYPGRRDRYEGELQ